MLDRGLIDALWATYRCDTGPCDAIDVRGLTTMWRHFAGAFEATFARLSTAPSRALINAMHRRTDAGAR